MANLFLLKNTCVLHTFLYLIIIFNFQELVRFGFVFFYLKSDEHKRQLFITQNCNNAINYLTWTARGSFKFQWL